MGDLRFGYWLDIQYCGAKNHMSQTVKKAPRQPVRGIDNFGNGYASVISGLAVLLSLIYLSLQLRQAARHQKASVHHDRLAHIEAYLVSVFGDAELMNLQVRGQAADSTLTGIEVNRFDSNAPFTMITSGPVKRYGAVALRARLRGP